MAYRWLSDLDVALTNAGLSFVPVGYSGADPTGASDWRTRGRPASTGSFDVRGVLCHHTASPAGTSDQSELNVILAGNGSAPGPISQLLLGRSNTIYLVAAGRANHGGSGIRPGVDSHCADMNAALIGIEASNNGTGEYWSDAMTVTYGRLVAALCDHYGWDVQTDVYLHATTGPPSGGCNSKIDPAGPWQAEPGLRGSTTWNLNTWRQWCAQYVGGANLPDAIPEDEPMTDADFDRIRQIVNGELTAWLRSAEYGDQIVQGNAAQAANGELTKWLRSPEYNGIVQQACREALAEQ